MAKILIVEDDTQLADTIREWLSFEHHTVEMAHDGAMAWEYMQSYSFDVVILDWDLPSMDGLELCRKFRARGGASPILFLTGKTAISDREIGLDSGADDYLVKPFHFKELLARIRALLRRPPVSQENVLTIGNISLDQAIHRVTMNNEEVRLQPKEFSLLEFLMRHPNQVFGSRALLDAVWTSESEASEDVVRTYVKTLRRKITTAGEPCLIQTVHGVGYIIETD